MKIDEKLLNRINELISSGRNLKIGNEDGQVLNENHRQMCKGWLAPSQNIVHLLIKETENPYRTAIDKICASERGYCIHESVGEVTIILQEMLRDVENGLVSSIEAQAKAEAFDDFLDHAKEYLKNKRPNEAGVIAGVVFEDILRTICRNNGIEEKGKKLDSIISELTKNNLFTQIKAKRARVSAHVRTKATHAQWDEFEQEDVETTIKFTEELILKFP